ncbi:MAG: hypothetical protein ACLFQB_09470 [Chitinispirillaceae bacterium]
MYERPQYLTPNGFKRLPLNPFRKEFPKTEKKNDSPKKQVEDTSSPATLSQFIVQQRKPRKPEPTKQISDKAAKLIAQALKDMLHS